MESPRSGGASLCAWNWGRGTWSQARFSLFFSGVFRDFQGFFGIVRVFGLFFRVFVFFFDV